MTTNLWLCSSNGGLFSCCCRSASKSSSYDGYDTECSSCHSQLFIPFHINPTQDKLYQCQYCSVEFQIQLEKEKKFEKLEMKHKAEDIKSGAASGSTSPKVNVVMDLATLKSKEKFEPKTIRVKSELTANGLELVAAKKQYAETMGGGEKDERGGAGEGARPGSLRQD